MWLQTLCVSQPSGGEYGSLNADQVRLPWVPILNYAGALPIFPHYGKVYALQLCVTHVNGMANKAQERALFLQRVFHVGEHIFSLTIISALQA